MPASKPAVLTATDTPVEAHLRHVIETQPVCLTRISADGVFLAVNEAALSMLGAERLDRILGTSLLALVAASHHDACRNFLKRICSGGRGSTELEMTGLGGLQHVLQLHAVTLTRSLDGVSSILCTFRDVTEHRRLESALVDVAARDKGDGEREGEWADLTAELDGAGAQASEEMAARIVDLERQLAEALARQQQLADDHERERADLIGNAQNIEQRFGLELQDRLGKVSEIEAALREAQSREQALVERHAADEAQLKQALADASAEHERQAAALQQAVADLERVVEEQRQGDLELKQQLAGAAAAHEQQTSELREAITRLESALAEATERALQLTAEHEAERAEWERQSQQLSAAHEAERAEWDRKTQQLTGSLDAERAAWEQRAADHEAAVAAERSRAEAVSGELQALHDETSRRRQEQGTEIERLETMLAAAAAEGAAVSAKLAQTAVEHAALERQIERGERLSEAGRLAASLAGDLESTLSALARSSQSLVEASLPDALRPTVTGLARGIAEARATVRRLARSAARADAAVEVDAVASIRQLEPALASLLGSKIAFSVIAATERAPVVLTTDDLEQVLLALIGNRRAAMTSGGQVTIEVAGVEIDEECARERGGVLPGPYLLIAVHTSGRGVDASMPAELVGRPAPADAWRAAGAGMSAVARIVMAAGGHVWLAREGDDALAFELYLPATDEGSAGRME